MFEGQLKSCLGSGMISLCMETLTKVGVGLGKTWLEGGGVAKGIGGTVLPAKSKFNGSEVEPRFRRVGAQHQRLLQQLSSRCNLAGLDLNRRQVAVGRRTCSALADGLALELLCNLKLA